MQGRYKGLGEIKRLFELTLKPPDTGSAADKSKPVKDGISMNDLPQICKQLAMPSIAISKEQFRRICHISKRHAKYLLDSGLVQCDNSGKKTYKYKIQMKDVWAYLVDREANPEKYRAPKGYYVRQSPKRSSCSWLPDPETVRRIAELGNTQLHALWERAARDYPDLMTVDDVCNLTGYHSKFIYNWQNHKDVVYFRIQGKLLFPKATLLEYLVQDTLHPVVCKSVRHQTLLQKYVAEYCTSL